MSSVYKSPFGKPARFPLSSVDEACDGAPFGRPPASLRTCVEEALREAATTKQRAPPVSSPMQHSTSPGPPAFDDDSRSPPVLGTPKLPSSFICGLKVSSKSVVKSPPPGFEGIVAPLVFYDPLTPPPSIPQREVMTPPESWPTRLIKRCTPTLVPFDPTTPPPADPTMSASREVLTPFDPSVPPPGVWPPQVSMNPSSTTVFDPTTPPPTTTVNSPEHGESDVLLEWPSEVEKFLCAEASADRRNAAWPPGDGRQLEDIEKFELTLDEIVEDFLRSLHSPTMANAPLSGNNTLEETVEKENEDFNRLQEENDSLRRELSEKDRIIEVLRAKLKLQSADVS